jgi:hypothetical protein
MSTELKELGVETLARRFASRIVETHLEYYISNTEKEDSFYINEHSPFQVHGWRSETHGCSSGCI